MHVEILQLKKPTRKPSKKIKKRNMGKDRNTEFTGETC